MSVLHRDNSGAWIHTTNGIQFFPLDPRPEDLDIRDIARALSMLCRYVGHVTRFYSVAEHSVRVSRRVEALAEAELGEGPRTRELAAWGLMHDASEAYLGDVARPVKHTPEMEAYRRAEKRLMAVIADRFDLAGPEPEIVRRVDAEILGTEVAQLKAPITAAWANTVPGGVLAPEWPGVVLGWSPGLAEQNFLRRFRRLVGSPLAFQKESP